VTVWLYSENRIKLFMYMYNSELFLENFAIKFKVNGQHTNSL